MIPVQNDHVDQIVEAQNSVFSNSDMLNLLKITNTHHIQKCNLDKPGDYIFHVVGECCTNG